MKTATDTTATVEVSLPIGDGMVLVLTADGLLELRHTKLAEPMQIDVVQLRNWLRRQVREMI